MATKKTKAAGSPDQGAGPRFGWRTVLAACLVVAVMVWLGLSLLRVVAPPPEPAAPHAEVREKAEPQRPYEEAVPDGLAHATREVDLALLDALNELHLSQANLTVAGIDRQEVDGQTFLFQSLEISGAVKPADFLAHFRQKLAQRAPTAQVREDGATLLVSLDGRPTHRLAFTGAASGQASLPPPQPPRPETPKPRGSGHGQLVIVIDDLGENLNFAKELTTLGVPVTFAIWPKASKTAETLAVARKAGVEYILHQPMEPYGHPRTKMGPGGVATSMSPEEIRSVIGANIAALPGIVGVNNHMGSRFTEDAPALRAALEEVKSHGIFFLDSQTTGKTVAIPVARSLGLPLLRRDVFLDNEQRVDAILVQIRKAERLAQLHGRAIAIGHPHKETMEALRQWVATRDANLEMASLTQLLQTLPAVAAGTPAPAAAPAVR